MKVFSFSILLLTIVSIQLGCTNTAHHQIDQTRIIDSLKLELNKRMSYEWELKSIGVLLDSIDANRQLLSIQLLDTPEYRMYAARLKDVNEWVKSSQAQIEILEKKVRTLKSDNQTSK